MPLSEEAIQRISKKAGLSPHEIRDLSPEKLREHFSKKTGKPFKITTEFPFIGRGNVLRDGLMSSEEINKTVDKLLEG